jgi:hypothetical protein
VKTRPLKVKTMDRGWMGNWEWDGTNFLDRKGLELWVPVHNKHGVLAIAQTMRGKLKLKNQNQNTKQRTAKSSLLNS